jgi:hypothetical protein
MAKVSKCQQQRRLVLNAEVMILCIKYLTDISEEMDSNLKGKHMVK